MASPWFFWRHSKLFFFRFAANIQDYSGKFSCSNYEQKKSYEDLFAANKNYPPPPDLHGLKNNPGLLGLNCWKKYIFCNFVLTSARELSLWKQFTYLHLAILITLFQKMKFALTFLNLKILQIYFHVAPLWFILVCKIPRFVVKSYRFGQFIVVF